MAVETHERISGCVLQIPLLILMLIAPHRTQIVPKSDQIKSAVQAEKNQGKCFKTADFSEKSS